MTAENNPSPKKRIQVKTPFGIDYFVLVLLLMIVIARFWPEPGIGEGAFDLPQLANYAVSLIFFFYGLRLNKDNLFVGLSNWKLHVTIQLSTFLLFPLLILVLKPFFGTGLQYLWLGTFFLASLPSTVSSSVVMVSVAEGNIPAAIFNAGISGILGVFITPLWMSLVLSSSSGDGETGTVMLKLFIQVLVPVVAGILLNPGWGKYAERYKRQLKYSDQVIILAIVYTSFSESFSKNMFSELDVVELIGLGLAMLCLFFTAFYFITLVCRLLGFKREDRITALFCGSKKSLVHGTVMSKVIFSNSNALGVMLLPLMMYHALQLIAASILAKKMVEAKRNTLDYNL